MVKETAGTGFGITLDEQRDTNPELVRRIETHWSKNMGKWTPGQIAHMDIDCGQADPRIEAANKAWGDFTASGGRGPRRR
jgi:hypothetical protein